MKIKARINSDPQATKTPVFTPFEYLMDPKDGELFLVLPRGTTHPKAVSCGEVHPDMLLSFNQDVARNVCRDAPFQPVGPTSWGATLVRVKPVSVDADGTIVFERE